MVLNLTAHRNHLESFQNQCSLFTQRRRLNCLVNGLYEQPGWDPLSVGSVTYTAHADTEFTDGLALHADQQESTVLHIGLPCALRGTRSRARSGARGQGLQRQPQGWCKRTLSPTSSAASGKLLTPSGPPFSIRKWDAGHHAKLQGYSG